MTNKQYLLQECPCLDTYAVLLGDIQLGRKVNQTLSEDPAQHHKIWGDTARNWLDAPALVCANLDCSITTSMAKDQVLSHREVHFRADPINVAALEAGGVDFVSLANKHVRDFRSIGVRETMAALYTADISFAGAGYKEDAEKGVVIEKDDVRHGILAFSDGPQEWRALNMYIGINYINPAAPDFNREALKTKISQFKEANQVDILIISMHWGPSWARRSPPAYIRQLFRDMIDAGASVVHGHGSHDFQGVEKYREGAILYSCGAFLNDYVVDKERRNDLGFVYVLVIANRSLKRLELHPTKLTQHPHKNKQVPLFYPQVNMAKGRDRATALSRMTDLSRELGTELLFKPKRHALFVPFEGDDLIPYARVPLTRQIWVLMSRLSTSVCLARSGFTRVKQGSGSFDADTQAVYRTPQRDPYGEYPVTAAPSLNRHLLASSRMLSTGLQEN